MISKKSMISKKKKRFKEKIEKQEVRFMRRRFKKGKGRFKCEKSLSSVKKRRFSLVSIIFINLQKLQLRLIV